MNAIYLNKWTSQFATERDIILSKAEWTEALEGITGKQVTAALSKCRSEFKWPPAIAEFIQTAKGEKNNWEQKGGAYKLHEKALPAPRASRNIKNAAMEQIRGIFRNKTANQQPQRRNKDVPTLEEMRIQPEQQA